MGKAEKVAEKGWISVQDEKPVGQDRLLFVVGDDEYQTWMVVGSWNRLTNAWCVNGEMLFDSELNVTHWRELPEEP